jgi:site-specific recombinase XerD
VDNAEFPVHLLPFPHISEEGSRHSSFEQKPAEVVFPMNRACRKRRSRLVVEGPLAPYFELYAEYLADQRYSQVSYWKKTFLITEFSRWLSREGISVDGITTAHEEAFLRHRSRRRRLKGGDRIALSGVTCWLREKGIIECTATASAETSAVDPVLQEYRSYLNEERGLAPATIENYSGYVRVFLSDTFSEGELCLASLHASQITDYIRRNAPQDRTFASAKHIVTALRSFFRFARCRDYIHTDLAAAVPFVAGWSMASIPRAMPADCVRVLLNASKKWRTPAGLRNRAILLLLARLGLRAGEVARLELGDIDWSEGCLSVHGKGRVERPLPLPHDVGKAIAAYLEHGRPESSCRRVFLRSRAPFDGLRSNSDICQIVARAIRRAGIELDSTGAHQLRHALAVDMLRQRASLTEIGQVLRHRSPDATRRYAKVDLEALREVALPWPEAMP